MPARDNIIDTALSPGFVMRMVQSFEHRTLWVIALSWLMALSVMMLSAYTLNLARQARHETVMLAATDPVIPEVRREPVDFLQAGTFLSQVRKQYPHVVFDTQDGQLIVTANDGGAFREWLTALEYVDVLRPEWQWSVREFCVGKCPTPDLMRAALVAEKIGLTIPAAN